MRRILWNARFLYRVRGLRAALILLLIALAMFFGVLERDSVLVQDAMLKDARVFRTPLRACDLTISDGEHYDSMPSPRCYFLPHKF